MSDPKIRATFLTLLSQSFGELTTALALAESVEEDGGEVSFIASPTAAKIVRSRFTDRAYEVTANLSRNHTIWRQAVRDFNPNVIVFSELFEFISPRAYQGCPLIDFKWLQELERLDVSLVWIDLMGFSRLLERALARVSSPPRFLQSFLERLCVILPCPLHDPQALEGRQGIPYRSINLPLKLDPGERARVRARYIGESGPNEGFLILHATGRWLRALAARLRLPLYQHLGELLGTYLADLPKVTLIDVSDLPALRSQGHPNLNVVSLKSMPPHEYETLLLSSDLVLTVNLWSYALAKALGNVTGLVLLNSYTLDELLKREGEPSPIRRFILDMERRRPGTVYPHACYPFPTDPVPMAEPSLRRTDSITTYFRPLFDEIIRAGLLSAPFLKAELYGGEETRELFRWALCDPTARLGIKEKEMAYIVRQSELSDGPTVLKSIIAHRPVVECVLDPVAFQEAH